MASPEVIRECIWEIKKRFSEYQLPPLKLPADSVIETVARECAKLIERGQSWESVRDLIPKEFTQSLAADNVDLNIYWAIENLVRKYNELKEASTYVFNKLQLNGCSKQDCFEFFAGKANLPGLKMAQELIEDERKVIKEMGPIVDISPSAEAVFTLCLNIIDKTIKNQGKPHA